MSAGHRWWQLALGEGTPLSALKIALVVGTVLVAINQGDAILAGQAPDLWKAGLTYCVPYCVATWGAVSAKRALRRVDPVADSRLPGGSQPSRFESDA